jgi:hypothetical protein
LMYKIGILEFIAILTPILRRATGPP